MKLRWTSLAIGAAATLAGACWHVGPLDDDSTAGTDADTDTDTDADTDTDVDTDTDTGTGTDTETDTGIDTDTVTDTDVLACIAQYDLPCDCMGGCDGGFGYTVLYPAEAGSFPGDIYPSEELLAAGVGWLYCAACDPCDEWIRIKSGVDWIDVDIYEFCVFVVEYDAACDGCLVESSGGGV
jgi:hypothetical protein